MQKKTIVLKEEPVKSFNSPSVPSTIDVCVNMLGEQSKVPDGFYQNDKKECVLISSPEKDKKPKTTVRPKIKSDVCLNLSGLQEVVPKGLWKNQKGDCVDDRIVKEEPKLPNSNSIPEPEEKNPVATQRPLRTLRQDRYWEYDCGSLNAYMGCKHRCLQTARTRRLCEEMYGPGRFDEEKRE